MTYVNIINNYLRIITNTNFFIIIQFSARKNNLQYMFQKPMKWCDKHIEKLGSYFNEGNTIMSFRIYLKVINISSIKLTFNDFNINVKRTF